MREAERKILHSVFSKLWMVLPADADPQLRGNVFASMRAYEPEPPEPAPIADQVEEAP